MRSSPLGPLMLIGAACAAGIVGVSYLAGNPFDWRYGLLLGYFIVISFVMLRWQEAVAHDAKLFVRRFMAGLTIKLMGSVLLMVVLVKTAPDGMAPVLAIVFVGLYVAFTVFSVTRLMKVARTLRT